MFVFIKLGYKYQHEGRRTNDGPALTHNACSPVCAAERYLTTRATGKIRNGQQWWCQRHQRVDPTFSFTQLYLFTDCTDQAQVLVIFTSTFFPILPPRVFFLQACLAREAHPSLLHAERADFPGW